MEGFLFFESCNCPGRRGVVLWIDGQGEVAVDLDLREIFGRSIDSLEVTLARIAWERASWFDPGSQSVVLITRDDVVREVALPSGEVSIPDARRRAAWIAAGPERVRIAAFDFLIRQGGEATGHAAAHARRIYEDPWAPSALRLRAAVLLAEAGEAIDARSLFVNAMEHVFGRSRCPSDRRTGVLRGRTATRGGRPRRCHRLALWLAPRPAGQCWGDLRRSSVLENRRWRRSGGGFRAW